MMDTMNTILLWRAIERIIAICVAGVCIYLGYRLFIKLPEQSDSSGKVILPGNISIYLSRIGPGVFFALFGAVIIGFSVYSSLSINQTVTSKPGGLEQTNSASYLGLAESAPFSGELDLVKADIRKMVELEKNLEKTGGNIWKPEIYEVTFRHMKLYAIKLIWQSSFGDYSQFELWVTGGCQKPIPKGFTNAAAIYLGGEK
jgi:hypothetical protein